MRELGAARPDSTAQQQPGPAPKDYARWLDIDPALIRVVHNGLETEALVAEAAAAPLDRAAGRPAGRGSRWSAAC